VSTRARRRRRRRWPLIAVGVLVLGVVFLLGVGLGLTLEERPQTGGTTTSVRTFLPPTSAPGRTTTTDTMTIP
jgi:hypothetical protein